MCEVGAHVPGKDQPPTVRVALEADAAVSGDAKREGHGSERVRGVGAGAGDAVSEGCWHRCG